MIIKASGITNLTDARYFAAKEVAFLGFNLEEGAEEYLDPMYMKAIREWVQGPKIVGEFARTPAATVQEAANFYGLDAVQVMHGADLSRLQGLEVILSVPVTSDIAALERIFRESAPVATYFLLDFSTLAQAETLLAEDADAWKSLFAAYPTILHLDLPAERLPGLLGALQPAGLALRGGAEEQVGVKSFDEIDAIFEALGMDY